MRVLLALLAACVVGLACAFFLDLNRALALSQCAFFLALIRIHPDRQVGVALMGVGFICAITGIVSSLYWPHHSLRTALLLDPSIWLSFIVDTATGYAFLLCGLASYLWGACIGASPVSASWRKHSFTTASLTPDHVIHINRHNSDEFKP